MAYFPDEWLARLRDNNDIVDVVSGYVALKPNGPRFWGLCPFHSEKTPSFTVHSEKQLFYCFGCHKGGDVIRFIMDIEKLEFAESVEFLAKRAHMDMPETDEKASQTRRSMDRLYELNRTAAKHFHGLLYSKEGKEALEYLHSRGIRDEIIRRFGLGYSQDEWDGLCAAMRREGFTDGELENAGLAKRGKNKVYDMFRNRVMFPIINHYGKVVGFGGRVLDDSKPKYINTPDTAVFNKRRNLYGLNYFKRGQTDSVVMVEGYMDVISLYAHGKVLAAASLGTALTQEQARLIRRYSQNVFIAYDGDSAGQAATLRGLDTLYEEGLNVRVVRFPEGADPDDFIRAKGRGAFVKAMAQAVPLLRYKLERLGEGYDETEEGRKQYAIAAAKIIAGAAYPVEQEAGLRYLQQKTGFSMETLAAQAKLSPQKIEGNTFGNNRDNKTSVKTGDREKAERYIANIITQDSGAAKTAMQKLEPEAFVNDICKRIAETVYSFVKMGKGYTAADIIGRFEAADDAAKAAEILEADLGTDNVNKLLEDCVNTISSHMLEEERERLVDELKNEENAERQKELIKKLQELDRRSRAKTDRV